jgi:hypothetical protein
MNYHATSAGILMDRRLFFVASDWEFDPERLNNLSPIREVGKSVASPEQVCTVQIETHVFGNRFAYIIGTLFIWGKGGRMTDTEKRNPRDVCSRCKSDTKQYVTLIGILVLLVLFFGAIQAQAE